MENNTANIMMALDALDIIRRSVLFDSVRSFKVCSIISKNENSTSLLEPCVEINLSEKSMPLSMATSLGLEDVTFDDDSVEGVLYGVIVKLF